MPFGGRIAEDSTTSLVELLVERAGLHPEKRLFTFLAEGESEQAHLSFAELDQRARTIAAHLAERGWAGHPALLLYPPGLEFIAAFCGCLYAGVIAVPCYPPRFNRPQPRLAGIARDAGPAAVLTTAAMVRQAQRLTPHLPEITALPWLATDALDDALADAWQMPAADPDALAFLQYTSGSTAAPKGVMVSHGNLVHNAEMIRRVCAHDEDAVVVSWLPPYHDMGLIAGILQPIYAGGRCVMMSPVAFLQKPLRWLAAITRYRGTTSGGPNFAYDLCVRKITAAERRDLELSSWRVAFNGAEPVRADTVERFARVFSRCGFDRRASYPCYGLAEATLLVTGGDRREEPRIEWFDPDALEAHRVAPVSGLRERILVGCGRPQSGQRLRIVDPDSLRPSTPERVGEIWVAGPSVAQGYWRRPQETAHDFDARLAGDEDEGPFLRTGDLGFLWDGELYVTGRLKDLIIIRGRNHYPQDLELTAGKAHALLGAGGGAAFSVESGDEERLVVVHELRRGAEKDLNFDADAVSDAVRQAISEEHEVQVWEVVLIPAARLFKTSSGKVQRRACRAAYLAGELPVVGPRQEDEEDGDGDGDEEQSLSAAGLRDLPFAERRPRLIEFLRGRLARVVGIAPQRLDPARPLTALGLDSLRAVELGSEIGDRLGIGPSQARLLAGVSLGEVADELLSALESAAQRTAPSPTAEADDDHPLSHGQRALWFIEQLRPGTTAYLLSGALWVKGPLDAGALERSLNRLITRHPALRTTFKTTAGEPRQLVHDAMPAEFAEVDAAAWTRTELDQRLAELARRPFELARGPLFRLTLFHRGDEQVLVVSIHHLISDLWSIALLLDELEALYRDETGGAAADLPAPAVAYTDYVRWQQAVLASERGEQLASFWQERLGGELPALDLPTDRPRPAVPAMTGGLETLRLDADLAAGVEALGERAGATLFTTLTAAFQVLLHRYSGQREILLGAPTAGRSAPELHGLIGYFVNPVVLRGDLGADPSFAVFLDRTRQTVLAAFAHQDYPFPRLAEDLPSVDAPIFQAMLVLQQTRHPGLAAAALGDGGAELELFGFRGESLRLPCRDAQFDLTLYVAPWEPRRRTPPADAVGAALCGRPCAPQPGTSLALEYAAELYDAATMRRLLHHFRVLLAAITADAGQSLSELPLLAAAERAQLLREWNDTGGAGAPARLDELVLAQVARTPERPAVVCGRTGSAVSYRELDQRSAALAAQLRALGLGPEERVGVCMPRTPELVVALVGVLRAGGAYVPIDPEYPAERRAFMIEDSAARWLVTARGVARASEALPQTDPFSDRTPAQGSAGDAQSWANASRPCRGSGARRAAQHSPGREPWVEVPSPAGKQGQAEPSPRSEVGTKIPVPGDDIVCLPLPPIGRPTPENLSHLIYTSGSTGVPKAVAIRHAAAVAMVRWSLARFRPEELRGVLLSTSVCFDISVFEIFVPLACGGTVFVAENALELPALAVRDRVTLINTVPSAMTELVRQEAVPPSVRTVNLAGEPLRRELADAVYGTGTVERVYNLYGPSEDTTYTTWARVGREGRVTIGRPLAGTRAYVLDRWGRPVPPGVAGELCAAGDGLARGYLGRPALSAERFVPNPFAREGGRRLYRTGDLVRYLPDGELDFLGRIDHQVKVRGFRIELGEIESALLAHATVHECVVVVRGDAERGSVLAAYVAGDRPQRAPLREHLRARLPEVMVPSALVVLGKLPLLPNGKVDRRALPAPELAALRRGYQPPRGPVEELVAGIWTRVLGVDRVGAHDDFFELGGHSLLATQVLSRLRETFGVELAVRELFAAPTLAALATRIAAVRGRKRPAAPPLVAAARDRPLPLSFAQERLWFLDQLQPDGIVYNMAGARRLRGPLDTAALAGAFAALVRRHEVLRTTFHSGDADENPQQVIAEAADFSLPVIDLSALGDGEAAWRPLSRHEARRPFDLTAGPLLRVHLVRLAADDHRLLLVMHHIVSDAWSLAILTREVAALYAGTPLAPLPVQYADHAVGQRQWLSGARVDSELDYWRRRLAGIPALPELPADRPRPAQTTHCGAAVALGLDAAATAAIEALSRRAGATPFMILLAAFQALLARHTGGDDVAVGCPVAGRNRIELEGLIGFFVNTLVLRGELGGDPTFRELLSRVRECTLDAVSHQEVPFERLVEELRPERSLAHSPFFQVAFAFENAPPWEMTLPGIEVLPLEVDPGTIRFDLELILEEHAGGLAGALRYNVDLFDATTARRLRDHFLALVASAVGDPYERLAALPMLSAGERHQLVVEWTDTATAYPRQSIPEVFAARVAERPEAPAVIGGEMHRSYGELDRHSSALARELARRGVGPEVPVGLAVDQAADLALAALAILKAGGLYVPLDLAYPPERLAFLAADTGLRVIVTRERLAASLPSAELVLLETDEGWQGQTCPGKRQGQGVPDTEGGGISARGAYVIYTSGSTGVPKGVLVPHAAVVRLVLETDYIALGPGDAVAQISNTAFDAVTFELWGALLTGACLVDVTRDTALSPARLVPALRERGITSLVMTTPLFNEVIRSDPAAFATVRDVLVGGEALDPDRTRECLEGGGPPQRLLNGYGPTESATFSSWHPIRAVPPGAATVPIGRAIANTTLYVLDRDQRLVPLGVAGELCIGGHGLAREYLRRPALTAEVFIPHPLSHEPGARLYRTGDRARILADGVVICLGRIDRQVKIRGFRIEPGEVEAVLARHPAVAEAVVLVDERDAVRGRRLVAFVVPDAAAPAAAELREFSSASLPDYMVPAALVLVDEIPLTPNRKIDRAALLARAADEEQALAGEETVAPRSDEERIVTEVWAEVLGTGPVSAGADFFALGGHSLLATRVASRLRRGCGIELPLRELFAHSTAAGLARRIAELRHEERAAELPQLVPVPRTGEVPLSFAQERLWFLDQLTPGEAAYNIPAAIELRGTLELPALAAGLNAIVRRHEPLRTCFAQSGERPVQVITAAAELPLPIVDLASLAAPDAEVRMGRLARAEARRPFDLGRGPLLRALLVRLAPDRHTLVVNQHHIVSDGWSLGVLLHELGTCYRGVVRGRPPELPALPIAYADYAVWQRRWLRGENLEQQLEHWRRRLAGAPTALELPADHPRPAILSQRGARERFQLAPALARELTRQAHALGATPFMVLTAAFKTLLRRITGEGDLVVGTPVAGRTHAELEPLIGFFVNTLVLRTDLQGHPGFEELVGRVRAVALDALAHQELPFEKLVEELQPERDMSRSPLVQVTFALQNAPLTSPELPGLEVEILDLDTGTAKFDLSLALFETAAGLAGDLEYHRDLFDRTTIRRLLGHWQGLLGAAVSDPSRRLDELPLLAAGERQQLLREWNDTRWPPAERGTTALHALFERQARRTPEAVALAWESGGERSEVLCYRQLDRRANRLARDLRARGVGPDELVAVAMTRSPEMIAGILGILKAGGAYLPLDPDSPPPRLAFMLADAGVRVVLADEDAAARLPAFAGAVVLPAPGEGEDPPAGGEPGGGEQLAYGIYTSGSTGKPKAALISHRAAVHHMRWMQRDFPLSAGDAILQRTPVFFDASVWELFSPLAAGARLVLAPPGSHGDPASLVAAMKRFGITVLQLVPSLLELLVDEPGFAAELPLRRLFCGGEPLTPALAERCRRRFPGPLINLYGPTEATIQNTFHRCRGGDPYRTVPLGRPIANARIHLLGLELDPLPIGVTGELAIASPGVGRGYLGRPALTAETFVPNPWAEVAGERVYRTGDLARYTPDGLPEMLGRRDFQIKVRGFRIELGEIEASLVAHEAVRECAVVARGGRLAAYLTAAADAAADVDVGELASHLRGRLPEHMVPSAFVVLERMPLLPNGKVDRAALPAPVWGPGEAESVAPRTPVEELLAGIWSEVLGVTGRLGVDDDFFELGGHSLLATQVISRLRRAGMELPVRALFEAPTIARLAERISAAHRLPAPPIRPAPRGPEMPLSFAQERLWFLDQLESGSAFYNIPMTVRLRGPLRIAVLRASVDHLVARHESLRTLFGDHDGRPFQVIAARLEVPVPLADLSALAPVDREAEARQRATAELRRPFDLARGPLLRLSLLRLAGAEHLLTLSCHHVIFDGWSTRVFTRELVELYEAALADRPPRLPALPVQYADYAAWQRQWLEAEVVAQQVAWWRERLEGLTGLELPADRPRPPVETFRGTHFRTALSAPLSRGLHALAQREGVSLFMALLAAFTALLRRTSGQDAAVGFPIANRNRSEVEGVLGFFANTLVLRVAPGRRPSFRELLVRVRETTLDAYAHQDLPFEKLVEEIQPERDMSRNPLFQVMLVLQNQPGGEAAFSAIEVEPVHLDPGTAKFDLTLFWWEEGGRLQGLVEYNTDLFDGTTIRRLQGHYLTLLEAMVADVEARPGELALLSRAERQHLIQEWNDTRTPGLGGRPVHRWVEEQAALRPGEMALVDAGRGLTYHQLDARANQLAWRLRGLGVGPERLVGICVERSAEMVAGFLAVLKAGGAGVALDPAYPKDRIATIIRDAGMTVLLTQDHLLESLPEHGGTNLLLSADWSAFAGEPTADPGVGVELDNPIYVIFTSGSTGQPKGIVVTHGAFANLVDWQLSCSSLARQARTVQFATFGFCVSFQEMFTSWCSGGSLVMADEMTRRDIDGLASFLESQEIERLHMPFAALKQLAEVAAGHDVLPARLKEVITAGEQLQVSPSVRALFERLPGCSLHNQYGASETHVVSAHSLPGSPAGWQPIPPAGRPVANVRIHLLDHHFRPVPIAVTGALYTAGACEARGYLNDPVGTAQKFVPDPWSPTPGGRLYQTGDLARYLADGEIEYFGRSDDQVKIRGFRIELGEVETVLARHPRVRDAAVLARDAGPVGNRLVAYVVPAAAGTEPEAELRSALEEALPEYMVPAVFVFLNGLPLNANGKLDREALPEPDWGAGEREYVAPRTPAEERLAEIWAEILGIERVGAEDHFFELGGHSLLATQVMSRLRAAFAVEVALRELFTAPTLAGLAARIEALQKETKTKTKMKRIAPVARDPGGMTLSFAQERLWFLERLEPGTAIYNMPAALRLRGPIEPAALRAALDHLVRRHESLRTTFRELEGRPLQVIAPPTGKGRDWHVVNLGALDRTARERELERLTAAEALAGFDLGRGPLLRARLVRLTGREWGLLLTLHHIITDGWSMQVLARELAALYAAAAAGEPSPLAELGIQYADYAAWQRRWLAGEEPARQLAWWRRQLEDRPPVLDLPADRPRPAVQTFRGGRRTMTLSPELSAALRTLGQEHGATPFMTLLAAFRVLLARLSGTWDVLVGAPIAGRTRAEVESLIGLFLNTLVLRVDLAPSGESPGLSFRELLEREREANLGAFGHQEVPFEKLLAELQPERDLSRTPLFQVFFNMTDFPLDTSQRLEMPGLSVELLTFPELPSKFDLTVYASDQPDGITMSWVYNADLFDAGRLVEMTAQYETLLQQAVADPEQPIAALSLVTPAARRILPDPTRPQDETWRGSVWERFVERARAMPAAPAVVEAGGSWSYGQLRAAAERLARELRAAGVRPQEFVSIHAHRRASLIAAILAVLKAGAVFHVLDPAYPARRTVAILRRARPRAWLEIAGENPVPGDVEAWLAGRNLRLRRRVPADLEAVGRDAPAEKVTSHLSPSGGTPPPPVTARDAAYVAFTSGSTGEPQGVVGSHGSLSHFIPWYRHTYELEPGDRFSLLAGLAHDPLHRDLFIPLLIGASIHIPSRDDLALPGRLGRWMERQAITVAHLTPAMASVLTQPPADGGAVVLPALRYAVFLGDVLKSSTVEAVRTLAPSAVLINSYGTTESQRAVSAWPIPSGAGAEIVPLGQGIADVQLLVLTPGRRLAGIGELGEIHIRSPHLACGYLDDEDRTAQRFPINPFTRDRAGDRLCITGDRGRFLPDGGVAFAGRADRQVKIRGFRVEAREIEIVLERHPGVHQAVVRPFADPQGQPRLVAYVVAVEPPRRPGGDELREYLRERLPDYMVPVRFLAIESVPLTPSRKIDEAALPAPDWQERDLPARYEAPRTAVERLLLEIWTRVLRIDAAGIHDNFFALGGDSLVVMHVVAEAERAGIELRPRQLFEHQTVAELAAAAGRGVTIRAEQGAVAGPAPLMPGQHWFFARMLERVRPAPHAFVMSGWVEVDRTLDAATVEAGLAELWRHHDALRLRFERDGGGWRQVYTRDSAPPLVRVDLSALAQQDQARALTAVPGLLAGGLHISRGPLVRCAWIDGGPPHRPRLLMLMHHLVGDVPSWGILRPDLENLCRRRRLGPKTTSLRTWSRRLAEYRDSEAIAGEVAYWDAMPERGDCCWPDDGDPAATGHGRTSLTLNPDETRQLLRGAGRRHAGAQEILLTALIRSCAETLGGSSLLLRITGHGRTPLDDEIDLSRTVGWLTTSVPVVLATDPAAPLRAALDDVCAQLGRIPSHGLGYGVLRNSRDRYPELADKMWRMTSGALVAFNFHGRVQAPAEEASPFIPLAESPPSIYRLPGGSSILRILCGVGHGDQQLWMQWIYSRRFFRASFVDRLVADYAEILTRFLALL